MKMQERDLKKRMLFDKLFKGSVIVLSCICMLPMFLILYLYT